MASNFLSANPYNYNKLTVANEVPYQPASVSIRSATFFYVLGEVWPRLTMGTVIASFGG
jgi:hypothetical protein